MRGLFNKGMLNLIKSTVIGKMILATVSSEGFKLEIYRPVRAK
ncbi:hypothetical protein [Candidatus Enterococcus huntleyi]|nr:hypothetical protein [Enterococcus sp. JM4C]